MVAFCCPVCKSSLSVALSELTCTACGRTFPILNGIPDFFVSEGESEAVDLVSAIWQVESVVKARNTIYRLCTRELRGMAYCMQEIACRAGAGARILEVAIGTGHFTRWLAEMVAPEVEIYAFDCSWPILQTAQANIHGLSAVSLFRANSRSKLPFLDASFDALLLRLAPLGPHGVPNVAVGYQLLKPGGWYFEAEWERNHAGSWTDWAIQHGFEHAEHHIWQYPRQMTEEERLAWQYEIAGWPADQRETSSSILNNVKMTTENLLIAHKPLSSIPTDRSNS
jgi:ubiquinone/menaquinone biosynthesis C-methylase UbiE/uncharacterized protein YbaR (Trm112 family)